MANRNPTYLRFLKSVILGVIGLGIGGICSVVFYEFVIVELHLSDAYQIIIFANVAIFLCLGFAVSDQIRCITCLTVPEFASTSGKRFLQACIMILLLSGPVENIGRNGEEVIRLVICLKDLTLNITLTGKDLLLAPIQHIIFDLKTEERNENSRHNFTELTKMVAPVLSEVEDLSDVDKMKAESDDLDAEMGHGKRSRKIESESKVKDEDTEAERVQKNYKRKIAYRCEDIFSKGTEKCKKVFGAKYDDCYEAVTKYVAWALCWPMKITYICDIIGMFAQDQICDLTGILPEDFGENYVGAKKGISEFTQKFKVKIDYQGITNFVNVDSIYLSKEEALETFQRGRAYIEYYMDLVKRTLAFSFLLMVFSALNYHGKYLERLSYDNCYLTKYFRLLDARRDVGGKSTLLPLKSFEKTHFTVVFRLRLRGDEKRRFFGQLLITLVQGLLAMVLFVFDYLFTRLLQLVKNHVDITFRQKGSHGIHFNIDGVGFLAQLLRSVVKDINVHKDIDILHFTKPCLPNPRHLHKSYLERTLLLFSFLLLTCYIEAVSGRTRHCIANFFYPKRSKERILWLYNETRRKRVGKLIQLKEQVLENADQLRKTVDFNALLALAETFPRLCSCFRWFGAGKRKCVLCKLSGEAFRCPKCNFSYCQPCYEDLDERCLYCIAVQELHERMYEEDYEVEKMV